jgi:hypothetical protein
MPALGIDPRTGQLIVLPGGGSGGSWGPSQQAADQRRQEIYTGRTIEEWQREDINWIRRLVEGYWEARERAKQEAKEQLAVSLALQNPYTAMAFAETGISPKLALENPTAFSAVAMAAFKKYQDDVKKAWQEGKGPIRPMTAEEFVQSLLDNVAYGYEYYIGLTGDFEVFPFTPTNLIDPAAAAASGSTFDSYLAQVLNAKTAPSFTKIKVPWQGTTSERSFSVWRGPGAYALLDLTEAAYLPQWLLTAKRSFSWATDDAWWLQDPDYLARNPDAARGYGKVSEAPPGWEKVGDGVYQDPSTGFLYFSGTGAYLGHGFLSTWKQNSGLFGAPVTNEFSKDGKVYQVFENGVLSWDPSTSEIKTYKNLDEAGLKPEDVVASSPSYWTSSGKEISQKELSSGGLKKTWTEDPYLGKGSSYYDSNPATQLLPASAPSSYSYYDIPGSSIQVNSKAVWVQSPSGQFQEPDPWIRSQFMSKIKTDSELKKWYYSLSDYDKNKVFANYIATGQIYL